MDRRELVRPVRRDHDEAAGRLHGDGNQAVPTDHGIRRVCVGRHHRNRVDDVAVDHDIDRVDVDPRRRLDRDIDGHRRTGAGDGVARTRGAELRGDVDAAADRRVTVAERVLDLGRVERAWIVGAELEARARIADR